MLREELARQRDMGARFEDAWPAAVAKACGDKWWMVAWDWSRPEWEACYKRQPRSPNSSVFEQLRFAETPFLDSDDDAA